MLLLEAEDEMKSKRISEIQNFLAEKMQELSWKLFYFFGARFKAEGKFWKKRPMVKSLSGSRLPALCLSYCKFLCLHHASFIYLFIYIHTYDAYVYIYVWVLHVPFPEGNVGHHVVQLILVPSKFGSSH